MAIRLSRERAFAQGPPHPIPLPVDQVGPRNLRLLAFTVVPTRVPLDAAKLAFDLLRRHLLEDEYVPIADDGEDAPTVRSPRS